MHEVDLFYSTMLISRGDVRVHQMAGFVSNSNTRLNSRGQPHEIDALNHCFCISVYLLYIVVSWISDGIISLWEVVKSLYEVVISSYCGHAIY